MKETSNVKEISKKHFDEIADNYNESHDGKFVLPSYELLIENVLSKKPDSILDLGCGTGNVLLGLTDKINAKLYGIDLSDEMIHVASKQLGSKALLTVGDAEKLPYDTDQFDLIICNASFHHYPHPVKVLSEIKRVLRPGGTFLLGDPTLPMGWCLKLVNWGLKFSNSGDFHIYGRKEIMKLLLENGFETLDFQKPDEKSFLLTARLPL